MKQTSLINIFPALGLLLLWTTSGLCHDHMADLSHALLAQSVDVQRGESERPAIQRPEEQGQIIRTAPDIIRPVVPPRDQARDGGRSLEAGWDSLGLGFYEQALNFFEQALALLPPGNQQNEASLGKAYALNALERHDQAVAALENLMQTGYRPEEVRAALFRILMQAGQLEQAETVLEELDDEHQQDLRRQEVQQIRFEQDLADALHSRSPEELQSFIDRYRSRLNQCMEPYAFFQVSQALHSLRARRQALEIDRQLLSCSLEGREQGLYIPLLQSVILNLPFEQAQREIARQRTEMQGRNEALAELSRLELQLLRSMIAGISPDDPEFAMLARQILRHAPEEDALRLTMAWNCFEAGDDVCAEDLFRHVLRNNPADKSALEGLVALLERQGRIKEAITLIEQAPSTALFLDTLSRFYRASAAELFAQQEYSQTLFWLDRYSDIAVEDHEALSMRSWSLFHLQQYEQALDKFAEQLALFPDDEDALAGKIYSLQAMDRHREALMILESRDKELSVELQAVLASLYCILGNEEYAAGNAHQAVAYLKQCVELNPDTRDVDLLGWSLLETGDPESAHSFFLQSHEQRPSEDTAQALLISAQELEDSAYFWNVLQDMAVHPGPDVRTIAADAFARQESPILAAQTHPESGKGTCYMNSDTPWMDIAVRYRNVSGDRGKSRLQALSVPMEYNRPVSRGGKWTLRATPQLLNSGKPDQDAYIGSYYRFLDQNRRHQTPVDKTWVISPEIQYQREGRYNFEAMLGMTPMGGPVSPMPVFRLNLSKSDDWSLELRQSSVTDSLLSTIGQKDPYSRKKWGRVMHSGVQAGKNIDLKGPYWLAVEAEYDYYWGRNVADNHRIGGNISVGRTKDFNGLELSSGLFLTAFHFQNNQNFYTFGHGGYFSPDHFFILGPFVRFLSPRCRDYWFDINASLGWMNYMNAGAPHYRNISSSSATGINTAALNDFQGKYSSRKKSGLAVAVDIQGMKLISNNLALGGMAGINNASDHTQWQAGLMLRYFFEHREVFFNRDGF
ncbi:cellulose synthase subunit BcsC-related outer membrane protein [Desulfonatronovibrio magnus]|uniref:cellulose synthase subunit BcsC-related outer membrane protein n=1 Tax=Desulfonatronovibrio magnus TaxID=698827 RepID=UPI0005EBD07B|nr:cellulose synthase subunit BcsC-related outer membrane protein [Desulfonatronovibrio magnus]